MSIDTDDQSEGRRSRDRGRSRGRSGDADLPPQLTPAELARQQAAQRAADAQSRSAQELKDVSVRLAPSPMCMHQSLSYACERSACAGPHIKLQLGGI